MWKRTIFSRLSLFERDLLSRAQNWRFGESRAYERFSVYPREVSSAVTVSLDVKWHFQCRYCIEFPLIKPSTYPHRQHFHPLVSLSMLRTRRESECRFSSAESFLSPFPVQRHMSESFRSTEPCANHPVYMLVTGAVSQQLNTDCCNERHPFIVCILCVDLRLHYDKYVTDVSHCCDIRCIWKLNFGSFVICVVCWRPFSVEWIKGGNLRYFPLQLPIIVCYFYLLQFPWKTTRME